MALSHNQVVNINSQKKHESKALFEISGNIESICLEEGVIVRGLNSENFRELMNSKDNMKKGRQEWPVFSIIL